MSSHNQDQKPRETYLQVRDVLCRIREAHQKLRDALEQAQFLSADLWTQLILDTLRKHEQESQRILARHQESADEKLLDTWLQYVPDSELFEALTTVEITPDSSASHVVEHKLQFDQKLLELLRQLAEESGVPRVREFFQSLKASEESRIARQAWSVTEYQADSEVPTPRGEP